MPGEILLKFSLKCIAININYKVNLNLIVLGQLCSDRQSVSLVRSLFNICLYNIHICIYMDIYNHLNEEHGMVFAQ